MQANATIYEVLTSERESPSLEMERMSMILVKKIIDESERCFKDGKDFLRLSKPLTAKTRQVLTDRLSSLEKPKPLADFNTLTLVLEPYFAEYASNLSDDRLIIQIKHMIEYIKHIPLSFIKKVIHNYITGQYGDVRYKPQTSEFINKCNELQQPIKVEIYLIKLVLDGIEPVPIDEEQKLKVAELFKNVTDNLKADKAK
jgi:hypothetical protein